MTDTLRRDSDQNTLPLLLLMQNLVIALHYFDNILSLIDHSKKSKNMH